MEKVKSEEKREKSFNSLEEFLQIANLNFSRVGAEIRDCSQLEIQSTRGELDIVKDPNGDPDKRYLRLSGTNLVFNFEPITTLREFFAQSHSQGFEVSLGKLRNGEEYKVKESHEEYDLLEYKGQEAIKMAGTDTLFIFNSSQNPQPQKEGIKGNTIHMTLKEGTFQEFLSKIDSDKCIMCTIPITDYNEVDVLDVKKDYEMIKYKNLHGIHLLDANYFFVILPNPGKENEY